MLSSSILSCIIEITAITLIVQFISGKLQVEMSRGYIFFFALILSAYTDERAVILLITLLFIISELDRSEYRIPDVFTKTTLFTFTLLAGDNWQLLVLTWGWMALMYLITYLAPQSIGRGDVKLIGSLILVSPWMINVPPATYLLALLSLSSVLALPAALWNRKARRHVPFAPAISAAALLLLGLGMGGM